MIATRVERRIAELDQHRYRVRVPVTGWQVSTGWPDDIPFPDAARRLLELGVRTNLADTAEVVGNQFRASAAETETYWMTTEIEVPAGFEGEPVWLVAKTNAEALVYVDRYPWQGLDENRSQVLLEASGRVGQRHRVDIMVFSGRDRRDKSLTAELVKIDEPIASFRNDLRTVLGVARTLPPESTTAIHLWESLSSCMNVIDFRHGERIDVTAAAELLRSHVQRLRAGRHDTPDIDVYMVGNSHIDVTWLWTLAETRQKMGRTTATALRYMEQMPAYRFSQSQAQLYDFLREDFPQLFEQVQRRVREGRWEITGAAWVEPDCNIAGGEALVRQILYGQKFWREHFGLESNILWLPDTFGYAWALPQILRKSGISAFATQKLTWNDTNTFPHAHFFWEGMDGTRVRCTFPPVYVSRTYPEEIMGFYGKHPSKDVVPAMLYPYGYGDGGGGPVPEDVEIGMRLSEMPGFPRCHFSKVEDAVRSINDRADEIAATFGRTIPIWRGELYFEYHRGTLTSNARTKRYNRRCEMKLREAEIWSTLAAIGAGSPYPADQLGQSWKKMLLNQFHDILPGTSIPEVYPEAYAGYEECLREAEAVCVDALQALTEDSSDDDTFSVVNSLAWDVCDYVEVVVGASSPFRIVDDSGDEVPYQFVGVSESGTNRIGIEATVPALGRTTYRVSEGAPTSHHAISGTADTLENDRLSVRLDDCGQIVSIYDRHLEREWLAGPANVFQTFDDRPNNWEAWDINDWYQDAPLDLFSLEEQRLEEAGPVRTVIRLAFSTDSGSRIEQDIIMYRTIPRIDFDTRIDWREKRVLLKVAFPLAVRAANATHEIQYGSIERPVHQNTTWDSARFEVCAHKWSDLSEANGGVSLLNDCKYGHDVRDNVMRISLLRNPVHPDARCPTPSYLFPDQESEVVFSDTGQHRVRYAFYPHEGDWRNGTVQQAYSLNSPLRIVEGAVPAIGAWRVSDSSVVIEALKQSEDGEAYMLRVFESHGGRKKVSIDFPFEIASASPVDLMERPYDEDGAVELSSPRTVMFDLKPFEIRTLRIEAAGRDV